jgi:hypothetical protein
MGRFLIVIVVITGFTCVFTGPPAHGQSVTSQVTTGSVTSPAVTTSTNKPNPLPADDDNAVDPASLIPDLPTLPHARASLIGGTIQKVDRVQDLLTVRIFGGGKMKIFYDPRTHILRGAGVGLASDLRPGDRVYIDTILDGSTVFARNIRLATKAAAGKSEGVVVSYSPERNELLVRDQLSPDPVRLRIDSRTEIRKDGKAASASYLVPGTLVDVEFASQKDSRDAELVSILAVPGTDFTFSGEVTSLDLHIGLLVMTSSTDHKTYEINLDPSTVAIDDSLRPGVEVTTVANFDGERYTAKKVTVLPAN